MGAALRLLLLLSLAPLRGLANDGAASVAAGGVELRGEPRVAMARERLSIALNRIVVDYDFINESAEDVTTEVAFPIPEYQWSISERLDDFSSFRAWIDGKPIQVAKEVRAFVKGREVTDVFRALGVPADDFGSDEAVRGQWYSAHYPAETVARLKKEGLVDKDAEYPGWSLKVTFHWRQTFPAGKTVHVRHEYAPAAGFTYDVRATWDAQKAQLIEQPIDAEYLRSHHGGCLDDQTAAAIAKRVKSSISVSWVDYVLTTANTWKGPIRDFELIVERPEETRVSFCWDGKVEKIDATHFRARLKNFAPKDELAIYFFGVK